MSEVILPALRFPQGEAPRAFGLALTALSVSSRRELNSARYRYSETAIKRSKDAARIYDDKTRRLH